MSTIQIARRGTGSRPLADRERDAVGVGSSRAGTLLLGALIVLLCYAAFDHGAGGVSAGARLQVAVAAIGSLAAAAWLWSGALRFAAPRLASAAAVLLALFAVWSGVTVLWSVAPEQTWSELNRALTYVVVLVLALLAGASHARSIAFLAKGLLLVVLAVTVYALGQKVAPGLHVSGVFDLNQTQLAPRLEEPFGYWNALGLFIVFGVPLALAVVVDQTRRRRTRLGALLSIELMLLAIGLTYSRGALLALVCGLAVGVGLGGARLRSLMWLALACVATIPPLVYGLASRELTTVAVGLGPREAAGARLWVVLLVTLLALLVAGRRLIALEERVRVGPERARTIGRLLVGAAGALVVCAMLAVALSNRGLDGTVSHAWKSFTTTRAASNYDPGRLLSADSANRWVWWKEAVGAFSARPLSGWGAGSFPVLHLLYRQDTISVQQPHSVPLQFLAETGIIGAALAIGGYVLLIAGGVGAVRRRTGTGRVLAGSLLAGVVAYGIHALYDWDWDIPGVTLPALVMAGVLAGAGGRRVAELRPSFGPGFRALGLGAVTATLCAFAFSGVVPSLAASKASSAVVAASGSSRSALEHAERTAASATRLDPLSDAGLLASSTIALHLGDVDQARGYLLDAVKRDPSDTQAWVLLTLIELELHDHADWIKAVKRVAALDPMGRETRGLLRLVASEVPPQESATAIRTPLPPAAGG